MDLWDNNVSDRPQVLQETMNDDYTWCSWDIFLPVSVACELFNQLAVCLISQDIL